MKQEIALGRVVAENTGHWTSWLPLSSHTLSTLRSRGEERVGGKVTAEEAASGPAVMWRLNGLSGQKEGQGRAAHGFRDRALTVIPPLPQNKIAWLVWLSG